MLKTYLMQIFFLVSIIPFSASAEIGLEKSDLIRRALGTDRYDRIRMSAASLAILDNGFSGIQKEQLPCSVELVEQYEKNPGSPLKDTAHGRYMYTIVHEMLGKDRLNPPKIYLLNAHGLTNLKNAVQFAIEKKVGVILYAQNWEGGGDFNGEGFINETVNQATTHGIVWVNAAGNYGGHIANLKLDDSRVGSGLYFRSYLDENPTTIVLNWSAPHTTELTGTNQDLDLVIENSKGKVVAESTLTQVQHKESLGENETALARERISIPLAKDTYRIRVIKKSDNFSASDWVRITVFGNGNKVSHPETGRETDSIDFLDATIGQEVMVPADNPNVITVGETTEATAQGPTRDGRQKPEVLLPPFQVHFSNGEAITGASPAAAFFAASVLAMKAAKPTLNRTDILEFVNSITGNRHFTSCDRKKILQHYPQVLQLLEQKTEEPALLYAKTNEGRYVVGIRKHPLELGLPMCEENSLATSDFFLALNREEKLCLIQKEIAGNTTPYLEVRQARAKAETFEEMAWGKWHSYQKLWVTPIPEDL